VTALRLVEPFHFMAMLLPWGWAFSYLAAKDGGGTDGDRVLGDFVATVSVATYADLGVDGPPAPALAAHSFYIACWLATALAARLLWAWFTDIHSKSDPRVSAEGEWRATPLWVSESKTADLEEKLNSKEGLTTTPVDDSGNAAGKEPTGNTSPLIQSSTNVPSSHNAMSSPMTKGDFSTQDSDWPWVPEDPAAGEGGCGSPTLLQRHFHRNLEACPIGDEAKGWAGNAPPVVQEGEVPPLPALFRPCGSTVPVGKPGLASEPQEQPNGKTIHSYNSVAQGPSWRRCPAGMPSWSSSKGPAQGGRAHSKGRNQAARQQLGHIHKGPQAQSERCGPVVAQRPRSSSTTPEERELTPLEEAAAAADTIGLHDDSMLGTLRPSITQTAPDGMTLGPQGQAPQQQEVPGALNAARLAAELPSVQKQMIGEKLFSAISKTQPHLAARITGMMLEMDNRDLLMALGSEQQLKTRMGEAVRALAGAASIYAAPMRPVANETGDDATPPPHAIEDDGSSLEHDEPTDTLSPAEVAAHASVSARRHSFSANAHQASRQ
jgi:hypothetical protein